MWLRGWSGANPSVVSPRGQGGSSGGTHDSTALSDGRGSHGCSGEKQLRARQLRQKEQRWSAAGQGGGGGGGGAGCRN